MSNSALELPASAGKNPSENPQVNDWLLGIQAANLNRLHRAANFELHPDRCPICVGRGLLSEHVTASNTAGEVIAEYETFAPCVACIGMGIDPAKAVARAAGEAAQ